MGNAALPHQCMSEQKNKRLIRQSIRQRRRALTQAQLSFAARELARNTRKYYQLLLSQRVLSYSPISGEIDPKVVLNVLQAEIYLPRITHYKNGAMQFFRQQLDFNNASYGNLRLGISEPSGNEPNIAATHLDAVLMPLIAFDRNGYRIGMGGGFYDRSFAFRLRKSNLKRPLLVGLAHHFQEVESAFANSWDVPLDAIITDRELIVVK